MQILTVAQGVNDLSEFLAPVEGDPEALEAAGSPQAQRGLHAGGEDETGGRGTPDLRRLGTLFNERVREFVMSATRVRTRRSRL